MAEGEAAGGESHPSPPSGEVYDWYRRGLALLESGSPGAAAALLEHAHAQEPESASVVEALARALYDSGRYGEAAGTFSELAGRSPDNDYAQFGLGLALTRLGDFPRAAEHLAMAVAMRPQRQEYVRALKEVRATLRAREGEM